jgi:hypothetical protein
MKRYVAKTKRCERTRKVSYRDEESARRAITMIHNHPSVSDIEPIRWYECEFCGHIHLTSREERPR